jgi:hypothetical protein
MRRGSLLLVCSCAGALLLGASYLGESSGSASAGGSYEGRQVGRMVETRRTVSASVIDRAREVAYGLERAADELGDLVP